MPLSVVILAAGQGKRMKSELPKVLQPLAGAPLLAHVVATARALEPAAIHVVHGHGAELAPEPLAGLVRCLADRLVRLAPQSCERRQFPYLRSTVHLDLSSLSQGIRALALVLLQSAGAD